MRNTVPVLLERFVSPHHTEPTLAIQGAASQVEALCTPAAMPWGTCIERKTQCFVQFAVVQERVELYIGCVCIHISDHMCNMYNHVYAYLLRISLNGTLDCAQIGHVLLSWEVWPIGLAAEAWPSHRKYSSKATREMPSSAKATGKDGSGSSYSTSCCTCRGATRTKGGIYSRHQNPGPNWVDVVLGIESFLFTPVYNQLCKTPTCRPQGFSIFTAVHTNPGILVRGDMIIHRMYIFFKGRDGLVVYQSALWTRASLVSQERTTLHVSPWCT